MKRVDFDEIEALFHSAGFRAGQTAEGGKPAYTARQIASRQGGGPRCASQSAGIAPSRPPGIPIYQTSRLLIPKT